MPKVSVIIPVWNLWDMTAACLRSLAEHTGHRADCGLEVLVVDNGSGDATAEQLPVLGSALFGDAFKSHRLPRNMGFAIACNAGARAATGELLFFLNNDTRLTPGWLPPLVDTLKNPAIGATGPLLLYPDGRIQHCGIAVSPLGRLWHLYEYFPGRHKVPSRGRPLQAITGAALMLRRDDFFEVGAFHEEYRNGFEDVDLCCALRDRGRGLALTPQSVIVHYASQTAGRFEADKGNGEILFRRCKAILRPDLHLLAARDGYRLCLGPTLACWPALPEAKEERLNADFDANFDARTAKEEQPEDIADRLELALTENPLWLGGRLRLMDYLESGGRRREAVAAGLAALDFFPVPEVLTRLTRLARKEGRLEEVAPILGRLAEESEARPEDFCPKARSVRREARGRGDAALTRLMDEWLLRYAPE